MMGVTGGLCPRSTMRSKRDRWSVLFSRPLLLVAVAAVGFAVSVSEAFFFLAILFSLSGEGEA